MDEIKEPCTECKGAEVEMRPKYKVTYILGGSYYNEEVGRYLFPSPLRGYGVLVSATPSVSFETEELWRVTDNLYNQDIESVNITKVK